MGSLEAGMQLVYERVSCNITLHRDLSGPSQRAIVSPPPQPSPRSPLPWTRLLVSAPSGNGVGDTVTHNMDGDLHLSISSSKERYIEPV